MPYSYGSIYKIICTQDSNFCYIGSTFTTLNQRFHQHKSHYKMWLKTKKKNLSTYPYFDKYGIDNFKIILIKSYKVCRESQRDNAHLKVYEQLWMNKTKRAVNIHKAFNPLLKLDQKEYHKKYHKKTYENNKERKKEYDKKKYENNKEKIKEKTKKYRENNKEKIKEKEKKYRENNKEKNKERQKEYNKEKITCECGSIICKGDLSKHKKTKKHFNLMKQKEN